MNIHKIPLLKHCHQRSKRNLLSRNLLVLTLCGCNHVLEHDTSFPNVIVRRKAASYLMAAKGLRNKVIDKVNR